MNKRTCFEQQTTEYRDYNGGYFKTLISPVDTNGALAVIEMVLPQGAEPPMHQHKNEDESFYVLEGEMEFLIGTGKILIKMGEAAFAPRGVPHAFKISSLDARFITILTPGKLWEYFQEFSAPTIGKPSLRPIQGPPSADHLARLIEVMTGVYGITFAGGNLD